MMHRGNTWGREAFEMNSRASDTIFTIGHSTRTLTEFVALLRQVDVTLVVDVRSIPRSRTVPQFNGDTLPDSLAEDGIGYRQLAALGGRRHTISDVRPRTTCNGASLPCPELCRLRGDGRISRRVPVLRDLARGERCAIMCAEAVWWRCYRRIMPITCSPVACTSSISWGQARSFPRRSPPALAAWLMGRSTTPRFAAPRLARAESREGVTVIA